MSFTMDLERFKVKSLDDVDKVARKIALTAYRRIIMRTPVDTGRARGNWMCTIGTPAQMTEGLSAVNDRDKSGASTVATMQETILGWKPRTVSVWLANNLPYIGTLEHGRSKQAPNGMVKLTLTELGGIASDAATGAL